MDKQEQIDRFIAEAAPRHFKQAVRDAFACCESRGTPGVTLKTGMKVTGITPAPFCDCFVCSLATTLKRRGWDIRLAGGLYKPMTPYSGRGFGNG